MAHIPDRDELHALVDQRFRATYPTAPEKLVRTDPHFAEWRDVWIAVRDEVLNGEVNRVYWADNPDAPHTIDPANPAHHRFQQAWWAIHEAVLGNTPMPKEHEADDRGVDFSYARAECLQLAEAARPDLPADLVDAVDEWVKWALDKVENDHRAGMVTAEGAHAVVVDMHSPEHPDHANHQFQLTMWSQVIDGKVRAWITFQPALVDPAHAPAAPSVEHPAEQQPAAEHQTAPPQEQHHDAAPQEQHHDAAAPQVTVQIDGVELQGFEVHVRYYVTTTHQLGTLTLFCQLGPDGDASFAAAPLALTALEGTAVAVLPDYAYGDRLMVEVALLARAGEAYADTRVRVPVTVEDGALRRSGESILVS